MRRRLAVALVWLAGCSVVQPAPPPTTRAEQQAYDAAVARLEKDRAAGERDLEAFLTTYPKSSLSDDAAAALGDSAAARGDQEEAMRRYAVVVNRYPSSDRADGARVKIAAFELARGNREEADRQLDRVKLSRLSEAEERIAFRSLADLTDEPAEKLRWLSRLRTRETDEDALALVDVEIDEILPQLSAKELRSAADQIQPDVPAARIHVAEADAALDEGDLERAAEALDRASRLPLTPQYAARLKAVRERLQMREEGPARLSELPTFAEVENRGAPSTAGAVGTLGVVLPLTGKFAAFGEESLQGVLLAAGVFGTTGDGRPSMRVLVRDSAGRPERAAQAVRDLVRDDDVVAIVGPLLSGECEAAAAEAEAAGVPLVALTAREEIARDRPHVFRIRTEPREETELLVDHAMRALGAQRFAILYPKDTYGRGLRNLFWDAVERRGGEIVGVASYDPDATDFGKPIRRLVGYTLLTDREKDLIKEREKLIRGARRLPIEEAQLAREEAWAMTGPNETPLPPIVDFDAIFIPESHEKVVLIAPQLAYHEALKVWEKAPEGREEEEPARQLAHEVRLLGPNGWYHPDLIPIGQDHVEGALFTAHFYPESTLPFVRDFASSYRDTFRVVPDVLAAQAYDGANLVLVQLARGRRTRESVRDGLLGTKGYPGVTGVLSIQSDGNARKRPFLLGVEKGELVQLN